MSSDARGLLFIVSAPSGAGKTTLVERLVDETPRLKMSRSYTSRAIREGERDGVDYNFVTRARFEAMAASGEFLEWADVFGNLYGTRAADTEAILGAGRDLVLVIDVQGARQVRSRDTEACTIFVMPPSLAVLEQRLRGRSKDDEGAIRRRLEAARREVAAQKAEKEASGKWSRELEAERDAAVRVAAEHAEAAMVAEQKNAELEAELAELRR